MKKLPRVVIAGFPNVGKSTLFNRLVGMRKSLVHSLPGMTRDQVSMVCKIGDVQFELLDTGGFSDTGEDAISPLVRKKAWEASQGADVLLFVLDGKRELLPAEEDLYFSLKKLNKPVLVVVNKIDSPREEDNLGDFFRLGGSQLIPVSSEHKRNLELLESSLLDLLPRGAKGREETQPLKIAIVGRINVGKSSLINRLCGEEKLLVSEIPGTTRDSTDTLICRNQKPYCLVDTAGIRKLSRTRDKREKASIIKATKNISRADAVCLILDAKEFPTRQDTAIAHLAKKSGKPLILVLNKWDLVPQQEKVIEEVRKRVYRKLDFVSYAPLLFVSAVSGKRVIKILDTAEKVYDQGSKRIPTSQLNDFLSWVNENHPPVSRKKGRMKVKFMVQKRILPPTFFLFTHSPFSFSPSYEKFFVHLLREEFDFWGTPLRVFLKRN